MLYFRLSQWVRLSPAQTCAYRWIPAWPERQTEKGRQSGSYSSTASLDSWHIRLLMTGFIVPIVLPLPSNQTFASLSTRESYSQLSFHSERQPYLSSASLIYSFQCRRVDSFVKSTKRPGPPHQVPTARPSIPALSSEAGRNMPFAFISSSSGCTSSMPGLMLGETTMPRFSIWANQSAGSLKRLLFHVKVQRLMPSSVSTAQ